MTNAPINDAIHIAVRASVGLALAFRAKPEYFHIYSIVNSPVMVIGDHLCDTVEIHIIELLRKHV